MWEKGKIRPSPLYQIFLCFGQCSSSRPPPFASPAFSFTKMITFSLFNKFYQFTKFKIIHSQTGTKNMIMSLIYRSSNWDASSDEALENSLKNFFKKYGRFFLQFRNLNTSRTCSRLRKMLKYFFYKNSVYKNIEAQIC